MAKGNDIAITAVPRGNFKEATVMDASLPGTVMEIVPNTADVAGRPSIRHFSAADGKRRLIAILLPDYLSGQPETQAYTPGTRGFYYVPKAGEEFNMLCRAEPGTGVVHVNGDLMIVGSSDGKLISSYGTPESLPFILMESPGLLTADTLVFCMHTGY